MINLKNHILELLHAKDCFNSISLRITRTHAGRNDRMIKFDRLRQDYGDSRIDNRIGKRKYFFS